jgi:hypothetical protein
MTITRKFGSKNMREIYFPNGKSILFSYSTPVVVWDGDSTFFRTTEKYSTTTTRQINFFLNEARKEGRVHSMTEIVDVPQGTINRLVDEIRNQNRGA